MLITGHLIRYSRLRQSCFFTDEGFTLLELLLVMVVFAVLTAAAVPGLGFFYGSRPLLNTAAHIISLTDHGRSRAITEGKEFYLNIDIVNGHFYIARGDSFNLYDAGEAEGRVFVLPAGINIDLRHQPLLTEETDVPGLRIPGYNRFHALDDRSGVFSIPFYPDGTAMPALIALQDNRGNSLYVECQTPAGRFRTIETDDIL